MGKRLTGCLICFDCGRRMRQYGNVVQAQSAAKNEGKPYTIGHRCKKCEAKRYAGGSHIHPDHRVVGQGWRVRFKQVIDRIKDFQKKQKEAKGGVEIRKT